ncbi:hypothetical protein [Actinomadura atramentaria]|uniref:hypothetical protein n=1 Tax=Actinomadura atramentaria TaxID=1990 RepID=UPI000368740D|nr:hypothetical protein [Actinomadura atramentaria]
MKRPLAVTAATGLLLTAGPLLAPADAAPARAARYAYGRVTASTLEIRSRPTSKSPSKDHYVRGFQLEIECWTPGESVGGNTTWYKLGPDNRNFTQPGYVAARYVELLTNGPARC